jgi:hypothetical protein
MKKKIEKTEGKTIAEEIQYPSPRMSRQLPPSAEKLKEIIAAKKALIAGNKPQAGDMARIRALQIEEEAIKGEPVIFSEDWYEFSVFCQRMKISPSTGTKWLSNGWLAYSEIGRFRIINRKDIDEMMRRFRRPAFYWLQIDALIEEK